MDLQHITASDWAHLEEVHPEAFAYLLRCSLIGEWENLLSLNPLTLNNYQQKRMKELSDLLSYR